MSYPDQKEAWNLIPHIAWHPLWEEKATNLLHFCCKLLWFPDIPMRETGHLWVLKTLCLPQVRDTQTKGWWEKIKSKS